MSFTIWDFDDFQGVETKISTSRLDSKTIATDKQQF